MRIVSLRYLLPLAALFIAACGDGAVRSPDLPPEILYSGPNISCTPTAVTVGGTSQCVATGCVYQSVDAEGVVTRDTMRACPTPVWSVSNDNGTINEGGTFTAVKPGPVTITGTIPGASGETTITVSAACAASTAGFAIAPLNTTVVAGNTATYTATLLLNDGSTANVTSGTTFTSSDNRVTFTSNVASTPAQIDANFSTTITGSYNGSLFCSGVTGPATKTATLNVEESTLLAVDGLCIGVAPAATNFPGCRADTGACLLPNAPITLQDTDPPQTRDLVIRARYNNGLECNVTAETTITSNDTGVATVSGATVSGAGVGSTTITASFGGLTPTRPVTVTAIESLGKNSLSVFSKTPYGNTEPLSFNQTNTNKFACIGANNLVAGLGGEPLRAGLKAFALVASCPSNLIDAEGNCTALPPTDPENPPTEPVEPSVDGFNAIPRTHDENGVTNPQPANPALPLEDGIVWKTVAGYWGGTEQGCVEEGDTPSAHVGDTYAEPRVLLDSDSNGLPDEPTPASPDVTPGALQPNGLIYSEAAVRLGFSCVTATYSNPNNPTQTITDGMTVLILPATNDAIVGTDSFDGNQLCDTLAPLFGTGPLLGLVELRPVLSTITSNLTPVLQGLDALPIDSTVTALATALLPLTTPLIGALTPILNPVEDGVCQVTSAVNLLLGLLTGTTPQQACEEDPENPAP